MSRGNFKVEDITKAYFPVEAKLLFVQDEQQLDLYSALNSHMAITDVEKNHVFSVVTRNYHLVSNEHAVELGKDVFSRVFQSIKYDDLQCFNVTMPSTRSFCHIDLIHEKSDFEPWEKETWTPFIRVTNSYNKTKLLRYEIGFCRWACKNGLILGSKSIEFKYTHDKSAKEKIERMAENLGEIKAIEQEFISKLKSIKEIEFGKNLLFPLVLKVFDIKSDVTSGSLKDKLKRIENLAELRQHIENLATNYCQELGETGYTALNVITDFASRPQFVISPVARINGFQSNCSEWIDDFTNQIKQPSFNPFDYLQPQIETAKKLDVVIKELS